MFLADHATLNSNSSFDASDVETDALLNFNHVGFCHWSLLDNAEPVNPNLDIIHSKYHSVSHKVANFIITWRTACLKNFKIFG